MAILVDINTRILVQGITGDFGSRHAKASLDYGTQLVAGVTPGKGGQSFEHGSHKVPVYDTVSHAAKESGAAVFAYGAFVTAVINFLIIAFVVFMLVKAVNKLKGPAPVETPAPAGPSEVDLLKDILVALKK